MTKNCLWSL